MTPPIVERSTEQKAASLGWRADQLERRPAEEPAIQLPIVPTSYELTPLKFQWWNGSNKSGWGNDGTWVADATLPTGGYIDLPAVNDAIYMGMWLGPRGSIWSLGIGAYLTTDSGKVTYEFASAPVNHYRFSQVTGTSHPGGRRGDGTDKSGLGPHAGGFVTLDDPWGTPAFDWIALGGEYSLYQAANGWSWRDTVREWYMSGVDGAIGTQFYGASAGDWPTTGANERTYINGATNGWDGGADANTMTWLRIRVSSAGTGAGTHAKIGYVIVYRRDFDREPFS